MSNRRCYSTFIFSVINAHTPAHSWVLDRSHARVFFFIIPSLQVPAETRLDDARTLLVSCGSFFHDKILTVMQRGPSEARDDKMDNKRGPASPPLLWGPQIRPPALPLENRHRTQRKLLSAVLPHLAGLSCSASCLPPSLPLLSFLLMFSLLRRLNAGSIHRPATVRHPDTTGQASSGLCDASGVSLVVLIRGL